MRVKSGHRLRRSPGPRHIFRRRPSLLPAQAASHAAVGVCHAAESAARAVATASNTRRRARSPQIEAGAGAREPRSTALAARSSQASDRDVRPDRLKRDVGALILPRHDGRCAPPVAAVLPPGRAGDRGSVRRAFFTTTHPVRESRASVRAAPRSSRGVDASAADRERGSGRLVRRGVTVILQTRRRGRVRPSSTMAIPHDRRAGTRPS